MKIAVVIPAHCHPDILRMTVGSLLRAFACHELDIHIGFHSNYHDYCQDTSIFRDLKGVASMHFVDEIDWRQHGINRYSLMHATHIAFLFNQIRYCDFEYVLLLDDDVLIHRAFASDVRGYDLMGTLFDDSEGREGRRGDGTAFFCLPKISPWHLMLSRRFYQQILRVGWSILYPKDIPQGHPRHDQLIENYQLDRAKPSSQLIFMDTFADVLHHCRFGWDKLEVHDGFHVHLVPTRVFGEWATHFFFSSFNYGSVAYPGHAEEIQAAYKKAFPEGVTSIFDAYRKMKGT